MKCTVNTWPESQICTSCKHSVFVQSEPYEYLGSSAYVCTMNLETDGIRCHKYEEEKEDEKEVI